MPLVLLGLSGIALNVLIGRVYGSAVLGIFNQVLSAYIFFSMAAAGGMNYSVLRAIAEDPLDAARVASVTVGGLVPTVLLGAVATAAFYFARVPISALLDSPGVAEGIAAATPGLFCFALNKLLLGVVNGLRRMRAFAVYQSLRYLLLLLGFSLAGTFGVSGERLSFVWTFAEGILLFVLAIEVGMQVAWRQAHAWRSWVRTHVVYGVKSVLSAMMLELNARIDIWILGAYLDDAAVGIYSLAAILAEGVFQLMVVLQNNFNPLIARLIAAGEKSELEHMVRRARRWIVPSMLGIGLLATVVYPWTVPLFTERPEFAASSASFAILVAGIALASGWLPFSQTLLMAGKPGWHTLYMTLVVVTNVLFNVLLIPHLGINGAAVGTAIAFIASAVFLRVFVKRLVGVRL